jgi:hypothetical protein
MRLYRDSDSGRFYHITADYVYSWNVVGFLHKGHTSSYIREEQWESVGAKLSCPLEAVLLGVDVFNT